ncbi:lipopolysaccharide kinase InaA family protein [Leeuwenhoekiella parthenopeia]|uniref:Lipopolysaccharide kinase InaA family protein n=1 Tax=Leeuwenhoekiella parthenopeia TaxID=2890320 RepID=A0ABS8GMB7_9FLAO|nr:lipopolysaccharide kinase InaA family protein [Leeuwenhoekiella parthenopeia]MCC4211110.1 lipopolysaccharide kinase InaA family protein [Leeuwenhoekiella parthenopeia]
MKIITHTSAKNSLLKIKDLILHFDKKGKMLSDGSRNQIKIFELEGKPVAIKAFGLPNLINRVAYKYLRRSKAQRSFDFAQELLNRGIGTPHPVAYAIQEGVFFGKSYYVSNHLEADITYRTLVQDPNYPEWEEILKAFTRFTFEMHEKGIHFLDHSPGNTLIVKNGANYEFYLVDLNRMEFKAMDFETRMKNFSRLTPHRDMVHIMAKEYARLGNYDPIKTNETMWQKTQDFQERFRKKRALKKKLKFWKN